MLKLNIEKFIVVEYAGSMKESSHAKLHATSYICLFVVEWEREGWKKRDWRSARWTDSWVVPLVQALRKRWQDDYPSLNHNPSTPILPSPFVLLSFSLIPTSDHSPLAQASVTRTDFDNKKRVGDVAKKRRWQWSSAFCRYKGVSLDVSDVTELFVITLVATIHPQPLDL